MSVSVRPEKIWLSEHEPGMVLRAGTVRDTVYSGPTTTYLIEIAPGVSVAVLEQNTDRSRNEERWANGERVRSAGAPSTAWSADLNEELDVKHDVIVLGAGLAGLSAARDLAAARRRRAGAGGPRPGRRPGRAGRARRRPPRAARRRGGRQRAHRLPGLVAELGLTLVPSYVAEPGEIVRATPEDVSVGDPPSWFGPATTAAHEEVTASSPRWPRPSTRTTRGRTRTRPQLDAHRRRLAARASARRPPSCALWEIGQLSLSSGSYERTSMLAALRKNAGVPSEAHYSSDDWEGLRVAEGSATVALRMAAELGHRLRLGRRSRARRASRPTSCTVRLAHRRDVHRRAVVSALPVGPLRDVHITGVSDARLDRCTGSATRWPRRSPPPTPAVLARSRSQRPVRVRRRARQHLAAGPRASCPRSCRRSGSACSPASRPHLRQTSCSPRSPACTARPTTRRVLPAAVGHRPVDAGLRDPVDARAT